MEFLLEENVNPAALESRWRALEAQSATSFFLGWTWMAAWLAATGAQPTLLRGINAGHEQALGFISRPTGSAGRPSHVVALNEIGDGVHDVGFIEYNGLVGVPRDDALAADLAQFFLSARNAGPLQGWEELRLSGVPTSWAAQFTAAGCWVSTRAAQATYAIDLQALRQQGRGALDAMTSGTRQQIRRARRLYERSGDVSLTSVQGPEPQRAALAELTALHQARWRARGKPGAFASPVFVRLVEELLARGGPRGEVEFLRVSVGRRTIGLLLNLVARGEVLNYQSAFAEEDDNRLKPGLLTHALTIDHHLDAGSRIYDLLAGDARYKASLAAPREHLAWLVVRPRTFGAVLSTGRRWLGHRATRIFSRM